MGKRLHWTCTFDGCENVHYAKGFCNGHYLQQRDGRELTPLKEYRFSYSAAHKRVQVAKGNATDHVCVDCGNPANEWSYDHKDPNEMSQTLKKNGGWESGKWVERAYSANPDHYEARCLSCHWSFDRPSAVNQ